MFKGMMFACLRGLSLLPTAQILPGRRGDQQGTHMVFELTAKPLSCRNLGVMRVGKGDLSAGGAELMETGMILAPSRPQDWGGRERGQEGKQLSSTPPFLDFCL